MKFISQLNLFLLIGLLQLSACARVSTLNFYEHSYGQLPTRVVWIQVAGLQDDHLAMLKFFRPSVEDLTAFERMGCMGKVWSYNLYQLRPKSSSGLLSQLVGNKNIKDSCQDFSSTPIWTYMHQNGRQAGIFESGTDNDTGLDQALQCGENGRIFLQDATMWVMRPRDEGEKKLMYFHAQDPGQFRTGQVYYDRSCQKDGCFTGVFRNIEYVFESLRKNKMQYFFLIRDFSYFEALRQGRVLKAREILQEIEKTAQYFLDQVERDREMLLLISSSGAWNMEFPEGGKDWASFEEMGRPVLYKKTSLLSPVFARGARAENFCGIYEEAEILLRLGQGGPTSARD